MSHMIRVQPLTFSTAGGLYKMTPSNGLSETPGFAASQMQPHDKFQRLVKDAVLVQPRNALLSNEVLALRVLTGGTKSSVLP